MELERSNGIDMRKFLKRVICIFEKKIVLLEFLNRLTYSKNNIVYNMHNFGDRTDDIASCNESDNDDDENEVVDQRNIPSTSSRIQLLCSVCMENNPNIICIPCSHVKLCRSCYDTLNSEAIADNTMPQCPTCRSIIQKVMAVYL